MVKNDNGSRIVLSSNWKKSIFLLFFFSTLLLNFSCGSQQPGTNEIPFKTIENTLSKWEDIFIDDEIISFTRDGSEYELLSIGEMTISQSGSYFIIDSKQHKVIQFDSAGKYLRFIGDEGEGPGEYYIVGRPFLDSKQNFYIFDVGKMRINKYSPPDYKFEKQIKIGQSIQGMIVDDNGDFTFYLTSGSHVLYKTNSEGKFIKKTFEPKQELLRLFLARFRIGRFFKVSEKDFLFIYPEEYKIYLFDNDFNIKKILFADTPSRFFPFIGKFPKSLSPYSFTPRHSEWWGKTLHPASIYYIGNRLFIVGLLEYTNLSAKFYINIHDLDGNTYALGAEVPFDGLVRYAKDGCIYVVERDRIDDKGNIVPLKLHRFKLRLPGSVVE